MKKEAQNDSIMEKILYVLKIIFLIITSPIWVPWKVLFVRKSGNKFSEIDNKKKVIRAIHSPITIPLRLVAFVFIMFLEVMIFYKIRYSVMTYPITRESVQNYYLSPNIVNENPEYENLLKKAFDYIDNWDLDSKNKMYVIFDSEIVKMGFLYGSIGTTSHILNKFNTNETFREDIHDAVKDIDNVSARAVKEVPPELSYEEYDYIINPLTSLGVITDYRAVLDVLGPIGKSAVQKYNTNERSVDIDPKDIDDFLIKMIKFTKGTPIKDAF